MYLQVNDDYQTLQTPLTAPNNQKVSFYGAKSHNPKFLPTCKSASKELLTTANKNSTNNLRNNVDSKSSLKTVSAVSPTKKFMPEESRQVHPALVNYSV